MTTTENPPSARTSSKPRRIAGQTAWNVAAHRAERRHRVFRVGAVAVVVVFVLAAAALLLARPATPAQGHQVPIEGNRQYVAQGADTTYRNRPPSSGDHYPTPAGYGVFARELPLGNLVHSLEHGGVVVYYRQDLCDQSCVGELHSPAAFHIAYLRWLGRDR